MEEHYWNEFWVELCIDGFDTSTRYEISNYGRIKSYAYDKEFGRIKKHYQIKGYPSVTFKIHKGPSFTRYVHKLVAQHFLPEPKKDQLYVIHKDYNKLNNYVDNLAWASKKEKERHQFEGPNFRPVQGQRHYSKLSKTEVIRIKKMINNPNRKTRMKIIAKQFGISEMQLYRIKRGENWADVEV
jgi:hypothetical protein